MPIIPSRSEPELELLVTPIYAGAGRKARGETFRLRVRAALFDDAREIWRLGRMFKAIFDAPASR